MPSLAWPRSLRRQARSSRWAEGKPLWSHDRIDIELGHSFDPHLVTKSRMQHDGRWVIRYLRTIALIFISLSPDGTTFQPYHGIALDTFNVALDAAHDIL